MSKWQPTKTPAEIEVEQIAADLLKRGGSSMDNLTFAARDLGFPDHTAIHEAAKQIIAKWAAWVVYYDRLTLSCVKDRSAEGVETVGLDPKDESLAAKQDALTLSPISPSSP